MSSLPSCETGEVTSQTQTTVRVSFLAVLKTTLQGDHARHNVLVAQRGDCGCWLPLGHSERREVCGSLHSCTGQLRHQKSDGGCQLAAVVYTAEVLFQATEPPVLDWDFKCDQLTLFVPGYFF